MKQIINGIGYLHSTDIVHRDIKPGNILVTSTPDGYAIVKLGDFGLSQILHPDSLTSAMSSNVGTLTFKAPEFWDKKPNDRIRYHRNDDVYATGLTFSAMIQAIPGLSLMPKAECSMDHSETMMPIGLAAFSRMINKHSDINVVEYRATDSRTVKKLKEIIRGMTLISAKARLMAYTVESMALWLRPSSFCEEPPPSRSTHSFMADRSTMVGHVPI